MTAALFVGYLLAPWLEWDWFGVSPETRARLRGQYPDG